MAVRVLVFLSLFSFATATVSVASSATDSSSILSMSASPMDSGFMSVRIVFRRYYHVTIIGVASDRPILRLSVNGSMFLRVPMGSATF